MIIRAPDTRITLLMNLAESNQYSRQIFEYFSNRTYNAARTILNRVEVELPSVPTFAIMALFQELEKLSFGRLIEEGDEKPKFFWFFSLKDIGSVALGLNEMIAPLNVLYPADQELFSGETTRIRIPIRNGKFNATVVVPRDYTPKDLAAIRKTLTAA